LYRNQSELNHSGFGLLTLFFTPPVSQLSAAFSTSGEVLPDGVKLLGLSEKDLRSASWDHRPHHPCFRGDFQLFQAAKANKPDSNQILIQFDSVVCKLVENMVQHQTNASEASRAPPKKIETCYKNGVLEFLPTASFEFPGESSESTGGDAKGSTPSFGRFKFCWKHRGAGRDLACNIDDVYVYIYML
jgi:hypothetical protein